MTVNTPHGPDPAACADALEIASVLTLLAAAVLDFVGDQDRSVREALPRAPTPPGDQESHGAAASAARA